MQEIIGNNVKCTKIDDKLKLVIYYKSATTKTLVMKNNQAPSPPELKQTNLVYEYQCKLGECEHLTQNSYVGLTTTSLSRRLTMHVGSGAPKSHTRSHHRNTLTRDMLVNNTKIIRRENDKTRLHIYEALIIQQQNPVINMQDTGYTRTLKLFGNSSTRNTAQMASVA